MKALTIRQPWAQLIAVGVKTIETRSRRTNYRGRIAIHAGARFHEPFEEALEACHAAGFSWMDSVLLSASRRMPLGAVVATADLVDCVPMVHTTQPRNGHCLVVGPPPRYRLTLHGSPTEPSRDMSDQTPLGKYEPGRWAWLLANVQQIKPIPAKGRQGLWDWDAA